KFTLSSFVVFLFLTQVVYDAASQERFNSPASCSARGNGNNGQRGQSITLSSRGLVGGMCEWLAKSGALDKEGVMSNTRGDEKAKQLLRNVSWYDQDPKGMAHLLNKHGDLETVASALKEHFKGLAEPVTTINLYETFMRAERQI